MGGSSFAAVALLHFAAVAVGLQAVKWLGLCCFLSCIGQSLLALIVALATFPITKSRFFGDEVQADGKAVLITGCDSGFGNALAKRLDDKYFHVFASCLNPESPGAQELRSQCSKKLHVLQMDVTSDDSVKNALKYVKEHLGTSELWAVVNNAGIVKGLSSELTPLDDFRDCMEVNLYGTIRVTKTFLPLLRQSQGRIVNIASLAGRLPLAHSAPYCVSKHAAVGFSEAIRQEMLTWNVKVISVEPEFFKTNIISRENMERAFNSAYEKLDEETKSDYGEDYMRKLKTIQLNSEKIYRACPKIDIVIRDLEKAVCLEHPDYVYRPCRNWATRLFFYAFEIAPVVVHVMENRLVGFLCKFPKPKEACNRD